MNIPICLLCEFPREGTGVSRRGGGGEGGLKFLLAILVNLENAFIFTLRISNGKKINDIKYAHLCVKEGQNNLQKPYNNTQLRDLQFPFSAWRSARKLDEFVQHICTVLLVVPDFGTDYTPHLHFSDNFIL